MHMNVKGVAAPIFRGIRTRRHTYAVGEQGCRLLYDNQEDPYQQHNLIEDPTRARLMKDFDGEILDYPRKAEDPYPFEQRIRGKQASAKARSGRVARRRSIQFSDLEGSVSAAEVTRTRPATHCRDSADTYQQREPFRARPNSRRMGQRSLL